MYNQLSNEEKMLVNSEVASDSKGTGIAYLLWFFLGSLGIHRFYLNRKGSAIILLSLSVIGWLTTFIFIGFIFLFFVGIWLIIDLFLVSKMVKDENDLLRDYYSQQIVNQRERDYATF